MGADRSGPTRPKHDSAEIDRTIPIQKGADSVKTNRSSPTRRNANVDEGQSSRETFGGDRSGQGLSRPNRRSCPVEAGEHEEEWPRVQSKDTRGGRRKSGRINDIVREIYYNRPGKKVQVLDMVGRMEAMVQGHVTDTVVWLEILGMIEVEDEVDVVRRNLVDHRCQRSHLFPFLGTSRGCAGLVGVDVVRIFGYGVKPSETNKPGMRNIAHALSK